MLSSRAVKWFLLVGVLVVLLVTSAVFGIDWRKDHPGYVHTSSRVSLNWTCWNLIVWQGHGFQWWAGQSPSPTGPLDTHTPAAGSPAHYATGTLKFNTVHAATFTSDAGGKLTMRREPKNTPHTMECAVH